MGRKVHPIGFRLGISKPWASRWYANKDRYANQLHEDRGIRELVFLCGDAEGFPEEWRKKAQVKLSLSTLTLPHELARVVLAEQLYRAFTILSGHPYNK